MQVAIASGKGGTGKTTLATNLACVAALDHRSVVYLDCDVEEPNGQIFLEPKILSEEPILAPVPRVDPDLCTHCGACGEICQFSAIVCMGEQVLVFPELCHSCGGCAKVCEPAAISEVSREIGTLSSGTGDGVRYIQGLLNIGEAMSPPVVRVVKQTAPAAGLVIIDAPPGTSCPVIESVRGSDFVVLVTEPTPFGLHDLKLAVEMVRALGIPFGVVVNRAGMGDRETYRYCRQESVTILAEIDEDRRVAEAYSRGVLAYRAVPELEDQFRQLLESIEHAASSERVA